MSTAPGQLRAKLRSYQSRAANWMIGREKLGGSQLVGDTMKWPFCSQVVSLDKKSVFYYNPIRFVYYLSVVFSFMIVIFQITDFGNLPTLVFRCHD